MVYEKQQIVSVPSASFGGRHIDKQGQEESQKVDQLILKLS